MTKKAFIGSDYILSNAGFLTKNPSKSLGEVLSNASGGKIYKTLESLIKDVKLDLRKK